MNEYGMAEMERRLANVMRIATITEVDPGAARARVSFGGEAQSAWLPFAIARAGGARVWAPPTQGEQVTVLSPGGDTAQGVIMGSLYSNAGTAPSSDGEAYRIDLPGGVVIEVSGGAISITAPGDVTVNGDVIADGISLTTHVHGGVLQGPDDTEEPK